MTEETISPPELEKIAEGEGADLYLLEREEEDGWVKYLDLIVSFSKNYPVRRTEKLSRKELNELARLGKDEAEYRLLDKFGIANLKPGPGLPKGPYVSVDSTAYPTIQRLASQDNSQGDR